MKIVCRSEAFALVLMTVFAAPASAETIRSETCRKDGEVRTIAVESPGTVGLACDVVYTRAGNVAVPYNANMDKAFCQARAAELAATLIADGFDCATTASAEIEASLAGGDSAPATIEPAAPYDAPLDRQLELAQAAPAEPAPLPAIDAGAPQDATLANGSANGSASDAASDPANVPTSDQASVPANVSTGDPISDLLQQPAMAANDTPIAEPAPVAEPAPLAVETPPAKIVADNAAAPTTPRPKAAEPAATAEPVNLAAGARTSEYRAPRPPKTSGAPRIVGVQPSLDAVAAAPAAPAVAPAKIEGALPARNVADIIRNVLAANAAAWNEGNLDAFMSAYVNSPELLLVKGDAVTTGARDVRRHFESDIAANGMGRIDYRDITVTLTSADVATAIGHYELKRDSGDTSGVINLVLKLVDGRWRIAQDTRVANIALKP